MRWVTQYLYSLDNRQEVKTVSGQLSASLLNFLLAIEGVPLRADSILTLDIHQVDVECFNQSSLRLLKHCLNKIGRASCRERV